MTPIEQAALVEQLVELADKRAIAKQKAIECMRYIETCEDTPEDRRELEKRRAAEVATDEALREGLHAALASLEAAKQEPLTGWKLVPVEPTPEMLTAAGPMANYDFHARGASPDYDHVEWWRAMLDAAPSPGSGT